MIQNKWVGGRVPTPTNSTTLWTPTGVLQFNSKTDHQELELIHRLKAKFHKIAPTSEANCKFQVVSCTSVSHGPLLEFNNLLE